MGRQKQTKLPKNTHTTHFLSYFPPFFLRAMIGKKTLPFRFLSTLIPPSFVRSRSQLVSSLHPRETKLCYLHLPLWLFGNKNQSVCPFCALNAHFPLWYLGILGGLLEIYSFFSVHPLCPKLLSIEQSKTAVLLILTCANCDQLIPFPFSAKSTSHHFTR